jgi:VWFA-related protein
MPGSVVGTVAALAVVCAASTNPNLSAQSQKPSAPQGTFRVSTNLVEVDVVVFDNQGRFVPGLTADDLDVFEDGKKQNIQQFYLVTTATGSTATSGSTPVSAGSQGADPRGRRIFVLLFDEEHLTTESLTRLKVGAERFLSAQFAMGDVGGVFANSGMYHNRLTGDRGELLAAIRNVQPAFDNREGRLLKFREFPAIPSEADAVRIDYGDTRLVEQLTTKACQSSPQECANEGGSSQVSNHIENKAKFYVSEARNATAHTMRNLRTVSAHLGSIPGRKTIVFLSDGFFVDEVRAELQQISAIAARGGSTFYAIFGRGAGTVAGRSGPDVTTAEAGLISTFDGIKDGPEILASGTGGFVIRNIDDISRALGLVARDTSTYYVAGYQPENTVMDGKVRKIEVRPRVKDLHVRARKGYIASPLPVLQNGK